MSVIAVLTPNVRAERPALEVLPLPALPASPRSEATVSPPLRRPGFSVWTEALTTAWGFKHGPWELLKL